MNRISKFKSNLSGMFPSTTALADAISLYEFTAVSGLVIVSATALNTYTFALFCMYLLKGIVEFISKRYLFKYSRRPYNAEDCNVFNKGGGPKSMGFPSGHTTLAAFLMFVQANEATKGRKNIGLLIFTILMVVLIAWARTRKCHTSEQVVGGVALGSLLGLLFMGIENQWLIAIPRYAEDKAKFYNLFNV